MINFERKKDKIYSKSNINFNKIKKDSNSTISSLWDDIDDNENEDTNIENQDFSNKEYRNSLENILATKADIVIILAPYLKMRKKEFLAPWQNLHLPASKNGNIFIIDKDYAGISSDRLALFLEDFKSILEKLED